MTGSTSDVPRSARARRDVEKYLLPDEKAVIVTRRHWAVLLGPTVKSIPALLAGGWLLILDPKNRFTSSVGLIVIVAASIYYGLRVTEWWMRHFIVSRRRILLTSGVIARTVTLLPLRRITDLTWQETLLGQVLNYGTFRFESAGQDQALRHLTFLPDAPDLYRRVSGLLFGADWGGAPSGGDEEGNDERIGDGSPGRPPHGRRAGDRNDTQPIPGATPDHG
jgi:membrane protein YdbS with pleckstrin-like domain